MRLGVLSDLHWRATASSTATAWHGEGEFEHVLVRLRQALHCFAAHDVDAVLVAGDLADRGDLESIGQALETCGEASARVLVVAGNHDVAGDPLRLERACETLRLPGVASARGAGVVVGGVRVAGIHVGESDGRGEARLRELPHTTSWGGEPVVLLSHYPALSLSSVVSAPFRYPGDLADRAELAALLMARPAPTVVIAGHVHARAASTLGAVLQLSAGAMVEAPYECAVIDVEASADGGLAVRRECIRLADETAACEPVFAPARQRWIFDGSQWGAAVVEDRERGHALASAGMGAL